MLFVPYHNPSAASCASLENWMRANCSVNNCPEEYMNGNKLSEALYCAESRKLLLRIMNRMLLSASIFSSTHAGNSHQQTFVMTERLLLLRR